MNRIIVLKIYSIICALGSLLGAQRESHRRTKRPAGPPRAIPLFFRQRSMVGTRLTGETRGSRPGVPLNKFIGNGTSGSVGRAGGPGVRVGRFAGGILAAGFSRGVGGSFVGKRGGSGGFVCGGEALGGVGQGDVIGGEGIRVGKMVTYNVGGT